MPNLIKIVKADEKQKSKFFTITILSLTIYFIYRVNKLATITLANPTLSKVLFALIRPLELLLWRFPALKKEMLESLSNQCSPSGITLPMQIASRNKKNKESGKKLFQELLEIILTAGHTTSTLLWNSIIILAVLPDIQERVWQEQYEIFGEDNRDPTIDDLERMQFLDRFIKESLRFVAPPLIPKAATADIILDGITIPRGFGVFYILECIRMDPNHFKCPKVFDPDRFLEEDDSLKYTYIPFGIGIRNCPGKYFATTLTKIAISKVIRRIKLKPVDKHFRFEDLKYKSYLLKDIDNPPEILVEDRK